MVKNKIEEYPGDGMKKQIFDKNKKNSTQPKTRKVRYSTIKKEYDEIYIFCIQKGQTGFSAHISAFSKLARKYGSNKVESALLS